MIPLEAICWKVFRVTVKTQKLGIIDALYLRAILLDSVTEKVAFECKVTEQGK